MRNINEVILSGNLVREANIRKNENTTFADFMIASNRKAKQVDGKWTQGSDFIPVTAIGKNAERFNELTQGSTITLRGFIESYNYKKEEQTIYGLRVRAEEIISIDRKREQNIQIDNNE